MRALLRLWYRLNWAQRERELFRVRVARLHERLDAQERQLRELQRVIR